MLVEENKDYVAIADLLCGDCFVYDGGVWIKAEKSASAMNILPGGDSVPIVKLDGTIFYVSPSFMVERRSVNAHKITQRS